MNPLHVAILIATGTCFGWSIATGRTLLAGYTLGSAAIGFALLTGMVE